MVDIKYYLKFAGIGIALFTISFIILLLIGSQFTIVSIILGFVPIIFAVYKKSVIIKEMEENYRIFLDDLKDMLQAGVNITEALEITSRNDYSALNIYVKRIAAQVKIGIPFEKAMNNTFGQIKSPTIRRIVLVINQTLRAGGNFMKVFTTSTAYVEKIERLNRERMSRTFSVVSNSYMMFIVFVFIVIGIQIFFLPILDEQSTLNLDLLSGDVSAAAAAGSSIPIEKPKIDFSQHFFNLLLVQAAFAGPIIGKISENSLLAGLRHSIILLLISISIYFAASAFFAF